MYHSNEKYASIAEAARNNNISAATLSIYLSKNKTKIRNLTKTFSYDRE